MHYNHCHRATAHLQFIIIIITITIIIIKLRQSNFDNTGTAGNSNKNGEKFVEASQQIITFTFADFHRTHNQS
jgi:predicted nucleic acid binding AN1-type Zn finger protein